MKGFSTSRPTRSTQHNLLRYFLRYFLLSLILICLLFLIRSAFFSHAIECNVLPSIGALDSSLLVGPDAYEIEGRRFARQPRDFDEVWGAVAGERWFRLDRENGLRLKEEGGWGVWQEWIAAKKIARLKAEVVKSSDSSDVQWGRDWRVERGYLRIHQIHGRQSIFYVKEMARQRNLGKARGRREGITTYFPALVSQKYDGTCTVKYGRAQDTQVAIHIVLPYSGRPTRLARFLSLFALHVTDLDENLYLIIPVLEGEVLFVEQEVRKLHHVQVRGRVRLLRVGGDSSGKFSRAVAVRNAVKAVPRGGLVFVSDVDLAIGKEFWSACRLNVIEGAQVFFPVFFSLYPYGKKLQGKEGFWRKSSYGMVCMFRDDFESIGGFGGNEEERFNGWGHEDVVLYNRFRDSTEYGVFRALEPALLHKWHGKDCPHNDHYVSCMRTVYMTLAGQDRLAKLLIDAHVNTESLTGQAEPE